MSPINLFSLFFAGAILFAHPSIASLPVEIEPRYLSAVLLYRESKFTESIDAIDKLIAEAPAVSELWELKALALRGMKDIKGAKEIYEKLVELNSKTSHAATAPYRFDLGLLAYEASDWRTAREHFEIALAEEYHPHACHYYLGTIDYHEKAYASARDHLESALDSDDAQLKLSAQLYLGKTQQELKNHTEMVRTYHETRLFLRGLNPDVADNPSLRESAKNALETLDVALRPHESGIFFARVGTFGGYDSNVLSVPASSISEGTASSSSGFGVLRYAAGYSGSPLNDWQWLASYNGSANYEFSPNAKGGQFLSNNLIFQATKDSIRWTNYGFQGTLSGVMQSRDDANELRFQPYSLQARLGPFARWRVNRDWVIGAAAVVALQKSYLDDTRSESQQRGGWEGNATTFIARIKHEQWWNPTVSLNVGVNRTSGTEFRDLNTELSLTNPIYFSENLALSLGASMTFRYFHSRPASLRSDQMPALSATGILRLDDAFSLLSQIKYSQNLSNVANYRYHRLYLLAGLNASF